MDEKIRSQVERMLNMTGRTPAEAEAIQAKIDQLLARHGMTLDDLKQGVEMHHAAIEANLFADIVLRRCSHAIEELTRTKCWLSTNYSKKSGRPTNGNVYHFAGYAPDVEWANWLADHLVKTAHREAIQRFSNYRERNDFAAAFGREVGLRIKALHASMTEQHLVTTTQNAVVAADWRNPILEYMRDSLGVGLLGTSRSKGRSYTSGAAISAGKAAGEKASFGRPVGGSGGALRIGR